MKTILTIFLSCVFFAAFSQNKNFIDQPYLETNAKVDTLVVPDRIYLSIVIAEKDTKDKVSVEELENKMADMLKSLSIDLEKQLMLSDFSSNFKKYFLRQKDVLKSKAYTLLVYDAQTAGRAIMGLEDLGIANVNFEKTEYSEMETLKLELRSRAVLKAKEQGESMLEPIGQHLGSAIHISDFNTQTYNRFVARDAIQMSYAKEESYQPIDIDFDKIKVECELSVKFKIE